MVLRLAILFAACALVALPLADAAPSQVHLSQTPSGTVVSWALAGDTRGIPPGKVDWGASGVYGNTVPAQMVGYVDGTPYVGTSSANNIARDLAEAPATLYRAQLPAMPASTTFHYRVTDGAGIPSADFAATTLPAPHEKVRFVAYADQGTYEDGTLGPPGYRPAEVVDLALAQDPDLVLVAGDLSYSEEAALRFWNQWFDIIEPLAATRPFYAAVGNHDRDFVVGYEHWHKRFEFWHDEQNYAFDAGPVHFLVVNSQEACLEGEATEQVQRVNPNCMITTQSGAPIENRAITDFMRADLADAQARGRPWIVVAFHHPPYANGGYNETNSYNSYMRWLREHWLPIFEEYGVDLVITGHDHNYQRSWPMMAGVPSVGGSRYAEGEGIVYLVTGGGGRSTYTLGTPTPAWSAVAARAHHVTVVDATDGKLKVKALDLSGATIDSFEIRRTSGGPAQMAGSWALASVAASIGLLHWWRRERGAA